MTKRIPYSEKAYSIATKSGVRRHSDVAADKALIKKTVKPEALKSKGGACSRADGGKTAKKSAKTQINVLVAPREQSRTAPLSARPTGTASGIPSRSAVPVAPTGGLGAMLGGQSTPMAKKGGAIESRAKRVDGGPVRSRVGESMQSPPIGNSQLKRLANSD